MAIVKMKHVNFVGKKDYMEEFIEKYIDEGFGIQPEYAMSVLGNVKGMYSYKGTNSYAEAARRCETLLSDLGIEASEKSEAAVSEKVRKGGIEYATELIYEVEKLLEKLKAEKTAIDAEVAQRRQLLAQILDMEDLDADLEKLFKMRFFKIRIGRLTKKNFERLMIYAQELDMVVIHMRTVGDYEQLLYIMPEDSAVRVDGVFSSLQFERVFIPDGLSGTPKEICASLNGEINEKSARSAALAASICGVSESYRERLLEIHDYLAERGAVHEIMKYAAFSKDSFRIVGWIPEETYDRILPRLNEDSNVVVVADEGDEAKTVPPTKLKNNFLFKPFESVVTMYGLPAYNEIDPTPIVAIIYCLMVGFMFGDVGQGLIFFLAGLFLLKKKSALGGIFTGGGLMAMVFGFMYGSIFSNEEILEPLFMNPMENANITTMLVIGIGFGVVMMIAGMVLNIVNGIKAKDYGRVLLDRNGVAGLVFYGVIISIVVSLLFMGKVWASTAVLAICILIPFLIIFFKHPIENFLKKKPLMPDGASGFFIETIFEMIDMLLSFASNTISFVRLSAFAINHVGLSMAFNILAQMSSSPVAQTIIMIVGNIAIIVLEGMVVGIQGLRLTYYELFSRFYKGDGIPYEPISVKAEKSEKNVKPAKSGKKQ